MMDICGVEFPDYTSPVEMEEDVDYIIDDNNQKHDEEKETEFPYDTSPVDIEGGVRDRKDEMNEKIMRKKRHNSQMTLPLLRWRKVQVIENMKNMKT